MWIIIAVGIAVAVIMAAVHRRVALDADLGSVTERWLTEYRAAQAADSK